MAILNFHDFCTSLCELIGLPPPALEPDANGLTGFTVTCRRAQIGVVDERRGDTSAVLMAVQLGEAPADRELAITRALLNANFNMMGGHAPAFMRDPSTGQLWLCHGVPQAHVDVQAMFRMLGEMADVVDAWHDHQLLGPDTGATDRAGAHALAHFMNLA